MADLADLFSNLECPDVSCPKVVMDVCGHDAIQVTLEANGYTNLKLTCLEAVVNERIEGCLRVEGKTESAETTSESITVMRDQFENCVPVSEPSMSIMLASAMLLLSWKKWWSR